MVQSRIQKKVVDPKFYFIIIILFHFFYFLFIIIIIIIFFFLGGGCLFYPPLNPPLINLAFTMDYGISKNTLKTECNYVSHVSSLMHFMYMEVTL